MKHRFAVLLILGSFAAIATPVHAVDARGFIERAVTLIQSGQHELARTYLEPALIDPRLDPGERSRAYYLRGYSFYDEGLHVSALQDYNRALEFHPGNPVVLTAVAQLYLEGLGVEPDPALAIAFLERAAEADHAPASLRLGVAYLRGIGVEPNVEAAREWLTAAAEAELAPAMVYLGQSYRPPYTDPPEPERAREWFEKAEAAGAPDALAYLGFMAEEGEGAAADPEAARRYFERGAEAGSAVAQAKIGHMYLTGEGMDADPVKALEMFREAARQSHPTGFMGLAYLYDSGTGVEADKTEAMAWYERAALAGVIDAQLRMAYFGLERGGLAGQEQALRWLSRAAAQNHPQALNDYAWLLATSEFPEVRNGQQALTLALQAVERQRTPAYLDTLAAAYAEAGKFDQAVQTQQEALAMVPEADADLVSELRRHLKAFEAGQPWREKRDSDTRSDA